MLKTKDMYDEELQFAPVLEGGVSGKFISTIRGKAPEFIISIFSGDTLLEESGLDEEDPSGIDQPLVIDEPSAVPDSNVAPTPEPVKAVASAKKGIKRKAENSPATPVAKKAAKVPSRTASPAPSTPTAASTPAETEKTSRSGRIIKPKKFEDNENGEATPAKNVRPYILFLHLEIMCLSMYGCGLSIFYFPISHVFIYLL